jgi:hypothetical protein
MNVEGKVYLLEPVGEIGQKAWQSLVRNYLCQDDRVRCWVNHSYHIKVWPKEAIDDFPYCQAKLVDDQTEHYDFWLLEKAYEIFSNGLRKEQNVSQINSVLNHYLFNMVGANRKDEFDWYDGMAKALSKETVSYAGAQAAQDHGWELDKLESEIKEQSLDSVVAAWGIINYVIPRRMRFWEG